MIETQKIKKNNTLTFYSWANDNSDIKRILKEYR